MLADIIRAVLNEPDSPLTTSELTNLVISRIPPDQLREALEESVPSIIAQQRNASNKLLLREPESLPSVTAAVSQAASVTVGGARYASARSAILLEDRLLAVTITGTGNRTIRLATAKRADIRHEIDVNRSKGETLITRADIFDDMLHEMSGSNVSSPRDLPSESRRKYFIRRDCLGRF